MKYDELVRDLFSKPTAPLFARDLGRSELLDKALSYPSSYYPTIHVGGTNGKGSVSSKIAKALFLSGYRVGLYTSPHLYCYRERILVNEEKISEEEVLLGIERLQAISKDLGIEPTFFEITTFLAFQHFRNKQVDIAIIEVGLGGKFDPTNRIDPLFSVITSISKEHTQILGSTLDEIALQKGGIIKPNRPIVLGKTAQLPVLFEIAKEKNSPVLAVEESPPFFDEENRACARLCFELLSPSFSLSQTARAQGLEYRPFCRFEKRGSVVFDVAHNPGAISALLQALDLFFPDKQLHFLVSFSQDKDYPLCLKMISAVAKHIHLVPSSARSVPTKLLSKTLREQHFFNYTEHLSVKEGTLLSAELSQDALFIICGTFYMMKEATKALQR